MSSDILNKNQIEICEFAKKNFIETQNVYLTNRMTFVVKLRKEILRLVLSYESNSSEKINLSKIAHKFHQNVKKIIGQEKFSVKTLDFRKEYSKLFSIIEKSFIIPNKIIDAHDDKENSLSKFYFSHKLVSLLFEEVNYNNNIVAENYLTLYKAIIKLNSTYHSKIIADTLEQSDKNLVDDFSIEVVITEVVANIKQLEHDLENRIIVKLEELIENYKTSNEVLENSNKLSSKYSKKNIDNFEEKFNSNYKTKTQNHSDFYLGLFGNWNFFEDISTLNYFILYDFYETSGNLNKKIQDEITNEFDRIINLFTSVKLELENRKDSDNFLNYLKKKKKEVQHQLEDDLLIKMVRLLPYDNPAPIIKAYLSKVKSIIGTLPKERTITNLDNLTYNTKYELYTFSSKEIIENNIYNSAFSKLSEISKTARISVKEISSQVLGLGQISNYNFETAISVGESEDAILEETNVNSAYKIVNDGTDRIIEKCSGVSNQFSEVTTLAMDEFYSSVKKFTENLYKLNDSDELIQLKHKLSREKSKEETEIKIKKVQTNIKSFFPLIVGKGKELYSETKKKIFKISEKVGLTSVPKEVSEEILDYIVETEKQIESLPFIYQRLFKNSPVNDKRFFIGREIELEKIRKAYNHWESGKFAPTVIVSEKGAGASSLTNIAQEEFEKSLDVIHIRLRSTIFNPKDFIDLLCENLNEKDIIDFDDLIDKLNTHPSKRVIIIENIEDLFLRVVNGFDVMKMFAQIISLTNNNVYWIATCNKYAWNYLSKVINIQDYFAFVIKFNKFTDKRINEIIMTRHNMSGYRLMFIPTQDDLEDKQFQKLTEQNQQEFLLNKFFRELNNISQSNVALAQLFWLRSISELTESEIQITSLHNIDFSFLKNLNRQKVFSLAAILIHDGLTIEEHAKVFNFTNEESRLLLSAMLDDGELRITDKNYRVNFLLYVHVIKLLKSQNILH